MKSNYQLLILSLMLSGSVSYTYAQNTHNHDESLGSIDMDIDLDPHDHDAHANEDDHNHGRVSIDNSHDHDNLLEKESTPNKNQVSSIGDGHTGNLMDQDQHDHGHGDHDNLMEKYDEKGDVDTDEHGHEEEGIALTKEQRKQANILVREIQPQRVDYQIYAPGEIKANGYTSYVVSPRVESVILKRHVELGSHVSRGQSLVTLFSESVAAAQADYRVNIAEWERAQKLGRKTIGEKRYVEAMNQFISTKSKLKAFGLSNHAIRQLNQSEPTQVGEYTLVAATSGVVLSDDFHQGQRVESGNVLMELADESKLWVEARISGQKPIELPKDTPAMVNVSGEVFTAHVTQEAHVIDPITRTRVIRLVIDNKDHRLHPGMFADVYLQFKTENSVIALPESALMRSADDHWMVYVEDHPGEYQAKEIKLGRMLGGAREIKGLSLGDRVVIEGAFFVASQQAKGGFDPHNH